MRYFTFIFALACAVVTANAEDLTIELNFPYGAIFAGNSITINPTVTGGEAPYTYEWCDQMNNVVGNEATLSVSPSYSYVYRLTVNSADGQTATAKTGVVVYSEAAVATFDDNFLESESFFIGDGEDDVFYSGSYAFEVSNMDFWWYGFSISSMTATTFTSYDDQYNSIVGCGVDGSANFCMAYPDGTKVKVTNSRDGDVVKGVYITNSANAATSMRNGDSFAKKFVKGDWYKVTISGKDIDGNEKCVDAYLADFRSDNEAEHYILDKWKWVDLSGLGKVTELNFTLSSTDNGAWGMNTPGYFCMDDLGSESPFTGIADVETTNAIITLKPGSIDIDGARNVAIYNLNGQLVATTSHADVAAGVYVVVADNKASKVIVK